MERILKTTQYTKRYGLGVVLHSIDLDGLTVTEIAVVRAARLRAADTVRVTAAQEKRHG